MAAITATPIAAPTAAPTLVDVLAPDTGCPVDIDAAADGLDVAIAAVFVSARDEVVGTVLGCLVVLPVAKVVEAGIPRAESDPVAYIKRD